MLKSIDILISLSVIMLVASMAVTVLTEFITHLRNTRGRNLQQGIADLLRLINPGFTKDVVDKIAAAVLTHPLIRDKKDRMGTVVHREELTKLLMELAAGNGAQQVEPAIQTLLLKTLAEHGIPDPAATLDNIRTVALRLEKSNPELSSVARANLAILHEAETKFVAKINTWFDQTMDRVSQRFTISVRGTTTWCGFVLAVVLQLDAIALVNRLSVDDAVRASLVKQAENTTRQADLNAPTTSNLYDVFTSQGLLAVPKYPEDLAKLADPRHLTGILFTTLLLSLGAPFWYNALKQFLQLRSKLAQEDDTQRKQRQSTQDAVNTPAGPAPVSPGLNPGGLAGMLRGERGDLSGAANSLSIQSQMPRSTSSRSPADPQA